MRLTELKLPLDHSESELRSALATARARTRTQVIVIDTTHGRTTEDGGCWWEVAIPEVSQREQVRAARTAYEAARREQQA